MKRWVYHAAGAFEAEHALTLYRGKPEEKHRHRWKVEVQVGTDELNREHYGLDFHEVHAILEELIDSLHHQDLNGNPEISKPSPSAENLALYIAGRLETTYRKVGGRLLQVSVWEGPRNRVDLNLDSSTGRTASRPASRTRR